MRTNVWLTLGLMAALTASAFAAGQKYTFHIHGKQGQEIGKLTLSPAHHGGVKVKVSLHDVPFGPHAVHFHENPVCDAPDFHSSGGHFNPTHKEHGWQNQLGHHAGDTPQNIDVDEDHMGEASFTLPDLSLDPKAPNSVFGTSFIVHEHGDDMKTNPSGEAGNRIGCVVIQH